VTEDRLQRPQGAGRLHSMTTMLNSRRPALLASPRARTTAVRIAVVLGLVLTPSALAQTCPRAWVRIEIPGPTARQEGGFAGVSLFALGSPSAPVLGEAGLLAGGVGQGPGGQPVVLGDTWIWAAPSATNSRPEWRIVPVTLSTPVQNAGLSFGFFRSKSGTFRVWSIVGGVKADGTISSAQQLFPAISGPAWSQNEGDETRRRFNHAVASVSNSVLSSIVVVAGGTGGCTPLLTTTLRSDTPGLGAPYPDLNGNWIAGAAQFSNESIVVVFGDRRSVCTAPASTLIIAQYSVLSNTWQALNWPAIPPRANAAVASRPLNTPSGLYEVVIFGGNAGDFPSTATLRDDTWIVNPETNTFTQVPGPGPSRRTARNQFIYDASRDWYVLFGGWNGEVLGDTWALVRTTTVGRQPSDAAVNPGQTATFSAAVGGPGTFSLRWQRNGVNLNDGATSSGSTVSGSATGTLTILNARLADAGTYWLAVTGSCGDTVSEPATLSVACPADYTRDGQLTPADIFAFLNAYFARCTATGPTPCQFGSADFNGDGSLTPADIFAFLNAYFARC
jgi:hypothetical protein